MTERIADRKMRFGGILENPYISQWQRDLLDGGRVEGLCRALSPYPYESLLDVGCGLGEGAILQRGLYAGIDNSAPRVSFASGKYREAAFVIADALRLPFGEKTFDMVMMVDASHHLLDEQIAPAVREMVRVGRKHIVLSDPVIVPGQSRLSAFFYSLDRGACFRTVEQMKSLLGAIPAVKLKDIREFRTTPGLYVHAAFILEII
ncbi:MAG: class I SAM-dependent methyltransferase [Candidatus Omnitrophota bacterium]|nr:class I SAM-dependent methyltransferase [Candidatus Omnitrophota bacterium]MDZ4241605.1 class I SAM-dependent methyltransferase [Candidatus Omnitrophota bacterium]